MLTPSREVFGGMMVTKVWQSGVFEFAERRCECTQLLAAFALADAAVVNDQFLQT